MKTSINIFNRLTKNEMATLTSEIKETIADLSHLNKIKSFSAADLWEIQRKRKSTVIRRYYM